MVFAEGSKRRRTRQSLLFMGDRSRPLGIEQDRDSVSRNVELRDFAVVQERSHGMTKWHSLRLSAEIDQDKNGAIGANAAASFDAVGNGSECRSDTARLGHPLRSRNNKLFIQDATDVGDAAATVRTGNDTRLTVEPAITGAIAEKHFRIRGRCFEVLGPSGDFAFTERTKNRYGFFQCVILFDLCSQSIRKIAGLTDGKQGVELIFHAGARTKDQVTAVFHVSG